MWLRFLAFPLALLAGIAAIGACAVGLVVVLAWPNLPSLEVLTDYQPKIPLRVYSAEGVLIGEFGEERRAVVKIAEVPELLKRSILAAEDERFYQHAGIDYQGVMRAAVSNLTSGGRRQGASTITMQVARNFFLSSEKTLTRKVYEALLAFKIENSLEKDQILELYVNQIYLGQRAYGFASAAQIYFGKSLDELDVAEVLPEVVDQGFIELLDHVYSTGEPFFARITHQGVAPVPPHAFPVPLHLTAGRHPPVAGHSSFLFRTRSYTSSSP